MYGLGCFGHNAACPSAYLEGSLGDDEALEAAQQVGHVGRDGAMVRRVREVQVPAATATAAATCLDGTFTHVRACLGWAAARACSTLCVTYRDEFEAKKEGELPRVGNRALMLGRGLWLLHTAVAARMDHGHAN